MSSFPDFLKYGYQLTHELGRNVSGGRYVYLAKERASTKQVVVKQFRFVTGASWAGYKQIEREIQVLRDLDHPSIPRYISTFETEDGYCIVQEYKNAQSLSVTRSFDPEQIKQIAAQILEILIYLQNRIPLVIHRDIKPENVLIDDNLRVYLIDFGFARVGGGDVSLSSTVSGTLGFMAPEQLRNREVTKATDLYGLGATLICLLTNTRSVGIDNLIDTNNCINFKSLLPSQLNQHFVTWLEKMVAPDLRERYGNAQEALNALNGLYVSRQPEITLDPVLEFTATKLGQKLSRTVTIPNSTPDTVLEGYLEVLPHPNDPPYAPDSHVWISIETESKKENQHRYRITVDTSKLKAEKNYLRKLVFKNNSSIPSYPIDVRVQTTKIPVGISLKISRFSVWIIIIPVLYLITLFYATGFMTSTAINTGIGFEPMTQTISESNSRFGNEPWNEAFVDSEKNSLRHTFINNRFNELKSKKIFQLKEVYSGQILVGAFIGNIVPILTSLLLTLLNRKKSRKSNYISILPEPCSGKLPLSFTIVSILGGALIPTYAYLFWTFSLCPIATQLSFYIIKRFDKYFQNGITSYDFYLLSFALGIIFWAGHLVGFFNPFVIIGFTVIGILFVSKLLLIPLQNKKRIQEYRKKEQNLINP
jgi:serine/threonine protein kinase